MEHQYLLLDNQANIKDENLNVIKPSAKKPELKMKDTFRNLVVLPMSQLSGTEKYTQVSMKEGT